MADDLSPQDKDLITRTVLSEAGQEGSPGMAAVASVIKNRVNSGQYGNSPSDVVKQPKAFSAWSLPSGDQNNPSRWSTKSPDYQKASALVDDVWSGKVPDNTNGADHYLNPKIVQATSGSLPGWAQGKPTAQIGNHAFYAPNGPVAPDLLGSWGAPQSSGDAPAAGSPAEDDLLGKWGAQPSAPAQAAPIQITVHPQGSVLPPGPETPSQWTNQQLAEHQGDSYGDEAARLGLGVLRGVGDVADTLGQGIAGAGRLGANALSSAGVIAPQTAASVNDWANQVNTGIVGDRNVFDARAANSPLAQAGRLGGQLLGTGPFVEAAGAPLAGSFAGRPIIGALSGGAGAGALGTGLTSASSDQPLTSQIGTGLASGAVLGPAGYGASALGRGLVRGLFGAVDPETAQLARTAQNYGIPVSGGQISTNPIMRFADSVLQRIPGTGYGARTEAQQSALNRAVSNTFGEDTDTITPATIRNARARIGQVFNDVAQRTGHIQIDQGFVNNVRNIIRDVQVQPDNVSQGVERQLRNVLSAVDPASGTIDADAYQALTRKNAPLDLAQRGNERTVAHYANQIRNALDDVMQRSAPADVAQDLIEARRQWRALKTVEPIVTPKKSPTGDVRPALLATQSSKSYPLGGTPLSELGSIGQRFLTEPPSSGTSERLLAMAGLGGLLTGEYKWDPDQFQRNALWTAAALGGGRLATAGLRSNALANTMINGALRAPIHGPSAAFIQRAAPLGALTYRQSDSSPGQ